jgi:peptidoglycan/LPS O-acetylase OafA/YrhL
MTHYSVIWIFGNYYATHKPDAAHLALIVTTGVLSMTGVAWLVMTLYDTPVRRLLRSKAWQGSSSATSVS